MIQLRRLSSEVKERFIMAGYQTRGRVGWVSKCGREEDECEPLSDTDVLYDFG